MFADRLAREVTPGPPSCLRLEPGTGEDEVFDRVVAMFRL
jgi:hypothetical protein